MTFEGIDTALEAFVDARREHRRRGNGRQRSARRRGEAVEIGAVQRDQQAGVGAELAGAHRQRLGERLAERLRPVPERGGEKDDRVDAAHLGINRDRLGACRGDLHQRESAAARTGETHGLDPRIGDERAAECVRRAGQIGEDAFVKPTACDRRADRACDKLARAGMRGVTLDHDRAARGERRRGVAAGDREGEREVARTEHCDGAERNVPAAEVGPRQRRAIGQGGIDRRVQPVARADKGGEHAQLPHRAAALALEPCARQAALGHCAFDQIVADRGNAVGNGFEKRRPRFERGFGKAGKGGIGERTGTVDMARVRGAKRRFDRLSGRRIDREEGLGCTVFGRADENRTSYHFGVLHCSWGRVCGRKARVISSLRAADAAMVSPINRVSVSSSSRTLRPACVTPPGLATRRAMSAGSAPASASIAADPAIVSAINRSACSRLSPMYSALI
eukprot:Opistho-1_new@63098